MRIIVKSTLIRFPRRYPNAEGPLRAWHAEAKKASWRSAAEVRAMYGSASFLGGNRIVFNLGGNKYRLIVRIHYNTRIVFIRFIGTHRQYDAIAAEEI